MGVYAAGYSVVVRNEIVEAVYPGGMTAYTRDAPNHTFCTDRHLARVGFMAYDSATDFIQRLIDMGFYSTPKGGQDIALVQQDRGVISDTAWASFALVDEMPVCYLSTRSAEPVAYPVHGPNEKLMYVDADMGGSFRFVAHEDGMDVWEDIRTHKRHYSAVMETDTTPGFRGIRLSYINERLLEIYKDQEKSGEQGAESAQDEHQNELEALCEESERLEKTLGAHHAHALYCAGLASRLLKRFSRAVDYYRACLASSPDNLSLMLELTFCLAEEGQIEDAREIAERSIKVAPDSAAAWGNLASACIELDLREEARSALDRAREIDPADTINLTLEAEFKSRFSNNPSVGDDCVSADSGHS